jgi:hypothetical protein
MRTTLNAVVLILALAIAGCASTSVPAGKTAYSFPCESDSCEIVGTGTPSTGGANFLVRRSGDRVILRAVDVDQDGTLDEVLQGQVSLQEANRLYSEGISAAMARGKCRTVNPLPTYSLTTDEGRYVVQGISAGDGDPFNRFFVTESSVPPRVLQFLDQGADGTLDVSEVGRVDPAGYQDVYRLVLEAGIVEGTIVLDRGRYIVRDGASRQTASRCLSAAAHAST